MPSLPFSQKKAPPPTNTNTEAERSTFSLQRFRELLISRALRILTSRIPGFTPLRNVYLELREAPRKDLAWMLPLALWVGWRTYQRVRREELMLSKQYNNNNNHNRKK